MESGLNTRPDMRLILAIVLLAGVRMAFAAHLDPLEDEAYYRLWGLYPSYAYFDHAPMVGWWIAIGQYIFSDTTLGLRFLSPISSLIGSYCFWRVALLSFDRNVASWAVVLFNAMPLIGIGGVIMTPDIPSVFFWVVGLWTLVEWNRSGRNVWWLAFGIAAGLGLLSKYTNVFLGAGVLVWLAASGRWRVAIRTPYFYIAGVVAILIFSPVIYWNFNHDWASFSKHLGRLQQHSFTLVYLGEWIGGQILLITPLISLYVFGAMRPRQMKIYLQNLNASLVLISFLPMLVYFFYQSFMGRVNANWIVPIYANFAILAAFFITQSIGRAQRFSHILPKLSIVLGFGLSFFLLFDAQFSILPADRRNPVVQLRGYEGVAADIASYATSHNVNVVVTNNYQLTGLFSYHLRDALPVVQISDRIRYLNMPRPSSDLFNNGALFVSVDHEVERTLHDFQSCFRKADLLGSIHRSDRDVILGTYEVWLIKGIDVRILRDGRPEDCKVD